MTTNTDLANAALGLLGEMPIASIDDANKPAVTCKAFVTAAIGEVLQLGRWNKVTKRGYPVEAVPADWLVGTTYALGDRAIYGGVTYVSRVGANLAKEPTVTSGWGDWWAVLVGYPHRFALPADFLRLMEINGEQVDATEEFYEIEGGYLLTESTEVAIRYIATETISGLGPLLQNAIALRLAAKIAVPLLGSFEKSAAMTSMFTKALAEARQVDAQESGSRENPGWSRVFGRSRLISAKTTTRNPLRMEDY
jgi:hypothetical protein